MSLRNPVFSCVCIVTVCCGQIPYELYLKMPKRGYLCACVQSSEASVQVVELYSVHAVESQ